MARLTDLPTELFIALCEYVCCDDFQNLRLVSINIKGKADSYLSTHRRRLRTPTVIYGVWEPNHPDSEPVIKVLRRIIRMPCDATYIRKLSIHRWRNSWHDSGDDQNDDSEEGTEDDTTNDTSKTDIPAQSAADREAETLAFLDEDLHKTAIGTLEDHLGPSFGWWKDDVRSGDESPLVKGLFLLLPELRTLCITKDAYVPHTGSTALDYLARNPACGLLAHLSTTNMSFREHTESYYTLCAFACIPSVRTIHTDGVDTENNTSVTSAFHLMDFSSNITELSFRNAMIHECWLYELLYCCPKLKTLEYVIPVQRALDPQMHDGMSTVFINPWMEGNPPPFATSLEKFAIRLGNIDFDEYIRLFEPFQPLREAEIDFRVVLLRNNGRSELTLLFPSTIQLSLPTIQKITIRYIERDIVNFSLLLDEVAELKQERLPNLKHLHFQHREEVEWEESPEEPEEYKGNHEAIVEASTIFVRSEVQRLLGIGVKLTSD